MVWELSWEGLEANDGYIVGQVGFKGSMGFQEKWVAGS